jgi:NAD(P)-dependent dehydrogenase (short-subunit alcohol dehydrogenase family)
MAQPSVFVTGADRGLGRAFVERFVAEGWSVFAGCLDLERGPASPRPGAAVAREPAPSESGAVVELPLDVADLESVRRARAMVEARTDHLDVLVNNAGINPDKDILLEDLDFELVRAVMEVNALGPLRVTQQLLPLLRQGSRKVIVNISSEAGSIARCGRKSWFGYCMSKASLNMQTRILGNYLDDQGFRVVSVHPGWMRTSMSSSDATFAPEESALSIYRLATGLDPLPQFVQWDGSEYPW